jgi:hypothetical protein
MIITSLGFHTFSIFQRLSHEDYTDITGSFAVKVRMGVLKKRPVKDKNERTIATEYTYVKSMGIRWLTISLDTNPKFSIYGVMAIINPKVLTGKNSDYIRISNESDLKKVRELFKIEADKISPLLSNMNYYSMSRGDYCINFEMKELKIPCSVERQLILIKRSNIPYSFTERTEFCDTSRRYKPKKDSFYLESDSVTINCYAKHGQLIRVHKSCHNIYESRDLLRFEVQCRNMKLNSISKSSLCKPKMSEYSSDKEVAEIIEDFMLLGRNPPAIPMDVLLSDEISADVIQKYFNKIIRKGDYYTLDIAKRMVESKGFHPKKEARLINTLISINNKRGISKAKENLTERELEIFRRSIRELEDLRINPVTIPAEWGIKHIRNLLDAYYDKVSEEQMKKHEEQRNLEIMQDYYKKKNRKSL